MKIQMMVAVVVTCVVGWWAQSPISAKAPPRHRKAHRHRRRQPEHRRAKLRTRQTGDRRDPCRRREEKALLKQESDRANQLTEKAMNLPAGSPERKKLEEEVLKMKADFELQGKRFDRDLRESEMKAMIALVADVNAELAKYSQANGTVLMLHSDPPVADLNDPKSIQQELGRLVVYQRSLDITPKILEGVNRRSAAPNSTGRAAGTDAASAALEPAEPIERLRR